MSDKRKELLMLGVSMLIPVMLYIVLNIFFEMPLWILPAMIIITLIANMKVDTKVKKSDYKQD
ncbi:MAG: hypothetical protein EA344_03060 [Alkalicoccus sp.]|nr:MAG: hypothetical protein EA344_03060 [Alkalicoccus sp.]